MNYIVGVDGAEGEVVGRDAHLSDGVEECRLAHIGQAHDTNLWQRIQGVRAVPTIGVELNELLNTRPPPCMAAARASRVEWKGGQRWL